MFISWKNVWAINNIKTGDSLVDVPDMRGNVYSITFYKKTISPWDHVLHHCTRLDKFIKREREKEETKVVYQKPTIIQMHKLAPINSFVNME